MSADNSGPAFPAYEYHNGAGQMLAVGGMSLRDYFAAKALVGFIAEPVEGIQCAMFFELSEQTCAALAASSYLMADAMLKERAK